MSNSIRAVILTGPTATGKTAIALELAELIPQLEIINSDSLLFYRGMDIGTAKPSPSELARVPHHLIDVRNPDQPYNAGDFVKDAERILEEISARGGKAIFVGGSGFYLKALRFGLWDAPKADLGLRKKMEAIPLPDLFETLTQLDPEFARKIGGNDQYRIIRALEMIELAGKTPTQLARGHPTTPDPRFELIVIDRENAKLEAQIKTRTLSMLERGLIEETQSLSGRYPTARALEAVGYFEVTRHLQGKLPTGRKLRPGTLGLQDEIELSTRQLVKKQRTWFKSQKDRQDFKLPQDEKSLMKVLKNFYEK